MNNLQFYPTPEPLALKAAGLFRNKNIKRLLEPQAGRADLLAAWLDNKSRRYRRPQIDCIEIDGENQAILRGKGLNVIDSDFLEFTGAAMYSHIIMNPPFLNGVDHVLKAWSLLAVGTEHEPCELVAILNAETIKNPFSDKRKHLCKLIHDFGSVEFISEAFNTDETKVKAEVEIALIRLEKKGNLKENFIHGLEVEYVEELKDGPKNSIALRQNTISNAVAVFNAAVRALRSAEIAREEANYYAGLLGKPLNKMFSTEGELKNEGITQRFNEGYDDLKKRAWTNVLHSAEFDKHLSSKVYQQLVADFEKVSKLSFTESNIRSFLIGLINGKSEMNMQMALECFDEVTKYRPENRAYYKGWKSNDKHREQAYRMRTARFIIPMRNSYCMGPSYEDIKKMQDFDKTFSMLDGKADTENGLYHLFQRYANDRKSDLWAGKRLSTEYFDVRWFKGVGSAHIFPKRKDLVDRLNRLVGRERQWLPTDETQATSEFWKHYENAEKITDLMQLPDSRYSRLHDVHTVAEEHTKACEKAGFNLSTMFALSHAA